MTSLQSIHMLQSSFKNVKRLDENNQEKAKVVVTWQLTSRCQTANLSTAAWTLDCIWTYGYSFHNLWVKYQCQSFFWTFNSWETFMYKINSQYPWAFRSQCKYQDKTYSTLKWDNCYCSLIELHLHILWSLQGLAGQALEPSAHSPKLMQQLHHWSI